MVLGHQLGGVNFRNRVIHKLLGPILVRVRHVSVLSNVFNGLAVGRIPQEFEGVCQNGFRRVKISLSTCVRHCFSKGFEAALRLVFNYLLDVIDNKTMLEIPLKQRSSQQNVGFLGGFLVFFFQNSC